MLKELDCVRVVKLLQNNRRFDGTETVKRSPKINDTGTIVHLYKNCYTVENVDSEGFTLWLADFTIEELEAVRWI